MRHTKATTTLAASLVLAFFGSRQALAQDDASQVDPVFVLTSEHSESRRYVDGHEQERKHVQGTNGQQTIAAPQIMKVGKKKNGVLVGALIGVGAGLPVGLALNAYASNEGLDGAYALIPVVMGLGIGIGIDALIPSTRTVHDRKSQTRVTVSPVIDRDRLGARVTLKF